MKLGSYEMEKLIGEGAFGKVYLTKKDGIPETSDLHDGMPDNSIIDAAIHLYDMEIEEGLY